MTPNIASQYDSTKIISHNNRSLQDIDLSAHKEKLQNATNLALSLDQELEILQELSTFELGKFLLVNKGLNGYWTSYIILHGLQKTQISPLEKWILTSAPTVLATRERFYIFQNSLQKYLNSNSTIASIPCGTMDDLTSLDTESFHNIHYVGIDYDNTSLELAKQNSAPCKKVSVHFQKKDAWNLDSPSQFTIVTSNGLNIYEADDNKVIDLYKSFYHSLQEGGILITSFLTPPPSLSPESPWKNYNPNDLLKQKAVFLDIIDANWQAFRTETQTRIQLQKAGFTHIHCIYDTQAMFPTVIARK